MSVEVIEMREKGRERMLTCKVTCYNISRPEQIVHLLPWRKQPKDTTAILEWYHHAISPQPFMSFKQTPPSFLSIFQWAKWFMSSEVKHGPAYESKFVKLAFPTQVHELIRLTFEYESPESATLLLTDCSFSRAIKAFVFHTIPQSHLLRRDDGGPFENNEAAWFIILIRRSETLAKPQLH